MRYVILQLARLGDILQTFPALQGLKKRDPDCHITFVCRSTFADAARLSACIDQLVTLPSEEIFLVEKSRAIRNLALWLIENFKTPYDELINLTYSESSSYLAEIIPAKKKKGLVRNVEGSLSIQDYWSQYVLAQVQGENLNLIHLNDLFTRVAGSSVGSWPVLLTECEAKVDVSCPENAYVVGVQVGASNASKTLPVSLLQKICRDVLEARSDVHFLFFGAQTDIEKITEVTQHLDRQRFTVLAGKLRFHENLCYLKKCKKVLTPDTAIAHLASLAGVSVLNYSAKNVRPHDTGPYGDCDHDIFILDGATEEAVAAATRDLLFRKRSPSKKIAHAKTKLLKCVDRSFRNVIEPVNFSYDEVRNLMSLSYYLLAEFRCSGHQENISIPALGKNGGKKSLKEISDQLLIIHDGLMALKKVSEYGRGICLEMIDKATSENVDVAFLKTRMESLLQTEKLLMELHSSVPLLRPLVATWKVTKDTSVANELHEVLGLTEGAYRELSQNIDIVLNLIETAVNKALEASTKKSDTKKGDRKKSRHAPGRSLDI